MSADTWCLIYRMIDMEDQVVVEWFSTRKDAFLALDEAVERRGSAREHLYVAKVARYESPRKDAQDG